MLRRVRASLRLHLASHFRLAFCNVPHSKYAFAYSSKRFEYMYRVTELVMNWFRRCCFRLSRGFLLSVN